MLLFLFINIITVLSDVSEKQFTVSFVGDSGIDENAISVFEKIESVGTDLLVHSGDLGYSKPLEFIELVSNYSFDIVTCYGEDDLDYLDLYPYNQSFTNVGNSDSQDYPINVVSWLPYSNVMYGSFSDIYSLGTGVANPLNICLFHLPRDIDVISEDLRTRFEICNSMNATIINGNYHTYNRKDNVLTVGTGGKELHRPREGDYDVSFSEYGFVSCRMNRCVFISLDGVRTDEFSI